MGRKSEISSEKVNHIISQVHHGCSITMAAQAVGVNHSTVYNWINRGKDEISRLEETNRVKPRKTELLYIELCEGVEQAAAQAYSLITNKLFESALMDGNVKAQIEWLSRKYPREWGATSRENTKPDEVIGALFKIHQQLANTPDLPEIIIE